MRLIGLAFTLTFYALNVRATPSCPTDQKLDAAASPERIKNFIAETKVRTIPEFICCIAKFPGMKIAIAPHSIAGQNGDYRNPRVLLVSAREVPIDRARPGPTQLEIDNIFSVNSGAAHLNQGHSVELMFNDRQRDELAYVDIAFKAHRMPDFSRRNPEDCMTCHGDAGAVPKHGPRPIFDILPWPRFIIGSKDPNDDGRKAFGTSLCPQRLKLEEQFESISQQALADSPNYACLKDLPRVSLADLDGALVDLNQRRVVKHMRSTPQFEQFKYAIVAAALPSCDFLPEDYLPVNVLRTMNDQSRLSAGLTKLDNPDQWTQFVNSERSRQVAAADLRDRLKGDLLERIRERKPVSLDEFEAVDSHLCTKSGATPKRAIVDAEESRRLFRSTNVVFNRYRADDKLRTQTPDIRFLFETRGIDTSDWNMAPTRGHYERGVNFIQALKNSEPESSLLRQIMSERNGKELCRKLRKASREAFGEKYFEKPSPPPVGTNR